MAGEGTARVGGARLAGWLRVLLGLGAAANLVLAAGFALQQQWALERWPWETGRLSYLFIGAMLAAIGVAAAWIALSAEAGALPAGFANLVVMLGGAGAYLATLDEHRSLGIGLLVLAVVNLGLLALTLRLPRATDQPIPVLVRGAFVVFTLVLVAVGLTLLLAGDDIMPWPLDEQSRVIFGWVFFGDAFYFAYAVARPQWPAARAPLWSFLAYDAVLLVPLALHLPDVAPERRANLVVYLAVLVVSALLAIWFLLLNPRTRGWGAAAQRAGSSSAVSSAR